MFGIKKITKMQMMKSETARALANIIWLFLFSLTKNFIGPPEWSSAPLACALTTDHMLTLITLGRFPTVHHSLDLHG